MPKPRSLASASATTGSGSTRPRSRSIFQLFASTKGSRGTGLGLPVSQKIIREHGGKISVTLPAGAGLDLRDRAARSQQTL